MSTRIISCSALALAGLLSLSAHAQVVSQTYRGAVTYADGPSANLIPVGTPITVTYTVAPATADTNPLSGEGVFEGGLVNLGIELPAVGLHITTGTGTVQTFDNASGTSDQAFFYSFDVDSIAVEGGAVTGAGVDFQDWEVGVSGEPEMLRSDAVPTHNLHAQYSTAYFYTAEGRTYFHFQASAEPTVSELVEDGIARLRDLASGGAVQGGVANALIAKLIDIQVAASAGDLEQACESLHAFRKQLERLRGKHITEGAANELDALAALLAQAMGC